MRFWLPAAAMGFLACAGSTPVGTTSSGMGGNASSSYGGALIGGAGGGGGGIVSSTIGAGGGGTCGDGIVDPGEECDDGNTTPNDGCTNCKVDCELGGKKNPANHHCYHLFEMPSNEGPAEMFCELWGGQAGLGHLVSINDASEQAFVESLGLGMNPAWIGGGDTPSTPGVYKWYDGTPFTYTHWATGEPNGPGVEDCIYMHIDGTWDDHACAFTWPSFICERRSAGLMD